MPTVPEAARRHTPALPPMGALPAESNVSARAALSVNAIVAGSAQNPKLLDRVRALIRTKHYSIKTERIYVFWIRQFVRFHGKRHRLDDPLNLHPKEVRAVHDLELAAGRGDVELPFALARKYPRIA